MKVLNGLVSLTSLLSAVHLAYAGSYGSHVVELSKSNFENLVLDSAATWIVKFYAPWCGHCQQAVPAFSKAAKKLDGVARVGVVNCDDEKELAQKYGISGFPTIKVFKGEGKRARRPSDYNGERSSSAIVDHAKYIMPNFIAQVKESGLDAFFSDEKKLPHILLFTDKKSTSPLYKGMAAEFRNRAAFGEVRKSDAGDLLDKYGVQTFPKLLAFSAGESNPEKASVHGGSIKPKSLRQFLNVVVSGKEPEDISETVEQKDADPVFAQPKAFNAEVVSIGSGQDYASECGLRRDGRMCGLAFLPGGTSHEFAKDLKNIAEKYQYDNLAFAVVDMTSADGGGAKLAKAFGIEDGDRGGFVTVRGRKKKFALHDPSEELSHAAVTGFLDRLVGGNARFAKLPNDLPSWDSPSHSEEKEDTESTTSTRSAESDKRTAEEESGTCGLDPPMNGATCG